MPERDLHPQEFEFHAFLDGELGRERSRAIENHLAACSPCQEQLAALRGLFEILNDLEEQPLVHDLAPNVLNTLASRQEAVKVGPGLGRAWRWTAMIQLLSAAILLGLSLPILNQALQSFMRLSRKPWLPLFTGTLRLLWQTSWLQTAHVNQLAARSSRFLQLNTWSPDLPLATLAILLAGAALLWIIGNGLLLRNGPLR